MISKGEKVGESDLVNNNRRIGTMQTQSQEVQLVSLHKEWYEMIIYEQNEKGMSLEISQVKSVRSKGIKVNDPLSIWWRELT